MLRRSLLVLASMAALASVSLLLVAFITPEAPTTRREADLGAVVEFPPGAVRTFVFDDSEPIPYEVDSSYRAGSATCRIPYGTIIMHIVHLPDGTLRALSAESSHLGEYVPWREDFSYEGSFGWFREPCHGDTYAYDGTRVFGPAPRDLGRYELRVEDGRVIVDPREHIAGYRPPPPPETPTPSGTPWPTAMATTEATPAP